MSVGYDVAVVGGGIVGLATAWNILEKEPGLRLAVIEKEDAPARHQTGRNSGVIHSGVYYRPGSLKARLCREGIRRLVEFCDARGIPYERCGKVIVATEERELPALEELHRRGAANGVEGLRPLGPEEIREIEPHVAGIQGLHLPETGIIDYGAVARALAKEIEAKGGALIFGARVIGFRERGSAAEIATSRGTVSAGTMVNCAGLYSDRIARMAGVDAGLRIVPFRGEYYMLRPEKRRLVRGLIYPVPDPRFPFLGVHFTRTIHGEVEAGPNAVWAFAREGYTKGTVVLNELVETIGYRGFHRLARRYWRVGAVELWRSFSKRAFLKSLQRLIPGVELDDLLPGPAGVRAQAVARDGALVDDFHIVEAPAAVHVLNAPSPGATASLAIGDTIAGTVLGRA